MEPNIRGTATGTANCPTGLNSYGGGFHINGASADVRQTGIFEYFPIDNSNTILIRGANDFYDVDATVVCQIDSIGTRTQQPGPSGFGTGNRIGTATCPSGTRVHGMGFFVEGISSMHVTRMEPASNLQAVTVEARPDNPADTTPWQVTAIAVCATPSIGMSSPVVATGANTSNSPKGPSVTCPLGQRILSVGWRLNPSTGVGADDLTVTLAQVSVGAGNVPGTSGDVDVRETTPISGNWSVGASPHTESAASPQEP